ncbi:threonine--tRNA ligase, partial [Thermoproteota archaeon]
MQSQFNLDTLRHSASHVLAQAVLRIFPQAKLGIGPSIEEGFYYDFDLPQTIHEDDLKKIEKEIKRIIKENHVFKRFEMEKADAVKFVRKLGQPYKEELIADIPDKIVSFYESGDFVDLCRGPHIDSTGQIKALKLLKVSGAYWRGSEKNKMLQRIYGTAFDTNEELDVYLNRLEEAQKRDHRRLGKDLDLFSIQDEAGAGLVLWHPKGAIIRTIIEDYWRKEHIKAGYSLLYTPHVGLAKLWETSGHLGFYQENMYSPMQVEN